MLLSVQARRHAQWPRPAEPVACMPLLLQQRSLLLGAWLPQSDMDRHKTGVRSAHFTTLAVSALVQAQAAKAANSMEARRRTPPGLPES